MYLENKYTNYYNAIIERAKSRILPDGTYTERHHILPKSLGGSNDKSNLVRLTAREHFICHLLLPKMVLGPAKRSMSFALWSMMNLDHSSARERYKVCGRMYEILKRQVAKASSDLHKGKIVSDDARRKLSEARKGKASPNKGKPMSDEQRKKLSRACKGRVPKPETVEKILNTRKGYKHSDETRAKIAQANTGKKKQYTEEQKAELSKKLSAAKQGVKPTWLSLRTPCPNCSKPMPANNFSRHVAKCSG